LLLSLGVGSALTSASVHIAELVTSLISGVQPLSDREVETAAVLAVCSRSGVTGAVAGRSRGEVSGRPAIKVVVAAFCSCSHHDRRAVRRKRHSGTPCRAAALAVHRVPAAFIDALGGGGWGPIATPSLLMSNVDPAEGGWDRQRRRVLRDLDHLDGVLLSALR